MGHANTRYGKHDKKDRMHGLVATAECQSGKRCFHKRKTAKQFIKGLERRFDRTYKVYRCPHCNYWHLATKNKHKASPPIQKEGEQKVR